MNRIPASTLPYVAGRDADEVSVLVALLRDRGLTLATAESLTGGRVAAALTGVAGASAVYLGGVVAYASEVKVAVLGVPDVVVEREGVVSAECAEAMARGARRLTGADVGLSTTGVAGPTEQEGRPVGTVFVAVSVGGTEQSLRLSLPGDRAAIQDATVVGALGLLHDILRGEEPAVR